MLIADEKLNCIEAEDSEILEVLRSDRTLVVDLAGAGDDPLEIYVVVTTRAGRSEVFSATYAASRRVTRVFRLPAPEVPMAGYRNALKQVIAHWEGYGFKLEPVKINYAKAMREVVIRSIPVIMSPLALRKLQDERNRPQSRLTRKDHAASSGEMAGNGKAEKDSAPLGPTAAAICEAEEVANREDAAARKLAEKAARKAAEEAARKLAEETTRRLAEETAHKEAEEAARKLASEEAARKKQVEEAARKEAEAAARNEAEEAARKLAAEEILWKKQVEDAVRQETEVAARKKQVEEAARKEVEAAAKKKAEEADRKLAAEEAARKEAEEAARKEAEEAARKEAEEAARKEAAAAAKKKAEEAARKLAVEEAARKKQAEEAARKEAEAAAKKKAEEAARKLAVEEAARKQAAEEVARKQAEEAARKEVEAAAKKRAEEDAQKQATEEAARKKAAEETARKQAAEETARKQAAEEAARKQAAEEAGQKKVADSAGEKLEEGPRSKAREAAWQQAEDARKKAEEAARSLTPQERAALIIERESKEAKVRAMVDEAAALLLGGGGTGGDAPGIPGESFTLVPGLETLTYAQPMEVAELYISLSMVLLTPENYPQQHCSAYICTFHRQNKVELYVVLRLRDSRRSLFYTPRRQPANMQEYRQLVAAAVRFLEVTGFLVEPTPLGSTAEDRKKSLAVMPFLTATGT